MQVQLAEAMQHGGATHPVATLATPATALATPATAAHESGPGTAQKFDVCVESESVRVEAMLPDGDAATLPGEPDTAAAQHTSSVALFLDTAASPDIILVPFQTAIVQSPCIAMTDSSAFGLLPFASGLTDWQYTMAVSPVRCKTVLVLECT